VVLYHGYGKVLTGFVVFSRKMGVLDYIFWYVLSTGCGVVRWCLFVWCVVGG
jgi:hypothetical protein